ncbi:predicted protein [Uncinocarpus reesii 1704]|uniref:Uncharacterized protein n=1 Tax=Uncinocarpus reesii (strain UAMH 1704) TaxID=336963 RepID=C4JP72_UNCRE|nr:uncharacterized protein UREG_03131 [Uncinocarpus reesii 1704]EEP78286.1 predicted protein [Uncinocarpus reesii 1704]
MSAILMHSPASITMNRLMTARDESGIKISHPIVSIAQPLTIVNFQLSYNLTATLTTPSSTQPRRSPSWHRAPTSPASPRNHAIPSRSLPPAAPSTIRRNLFHAHLSRRQHTTSTTSSSGTSRSRTHTHTLSGSGDGSGLSSALGGGISKSRLMTGVLSRGGSIADEGDIVARDKNGSYRVDIPTLRLGAFGEGAADGDEVMEVVEGCGHAGIEHEDGMSSMDKSSVFLLFAGELAFLCFVLTVCFYRNRCEHRGNDAAQSEQTTE